LVSGIFGSFLGFVLAQLRQYVGVFLDGPADLQQDGFVLLRQFSQFSQAFSNLFGCHLFFRCLGALFKGFGRGGAFVPRASHTFGFFTGGFLLLDAFTLGVNV
jgi:hypothetical protein